MTRKENHSELAGVNGIGQETWRDLARRIERENDPVRVMELARQLIEQLDREGFRRQAD
jgi:hypothetical protein